MRRHVLTSGGGRTRSDGAPLAAGPISVLAALLALSGPAPAVASELLNPADIDELCTYSRSVESHVFHVDEPTEPALDGGAEPAPTPLPGLPEVLPSVSAPDPVLTALRARDYARDRAQVLLETYEIVVDSNALPLWEYDEETASLVSVLPSEFDVFAGARRLRPVGLDALRFATDPETAADALEAHEMGSLGVRLTFVVAARARPWLDACELSTEAPPTLEINILSARLEAAWDEHTRCQAETVAHRAQWVRDQVERVGVAPGHRPVVEVMSVDLGDDDDALDGDDEVADEALVVRATLEALLTECYLVGLNRNASLRGALVFAFDVDADGRVVRPRVDVDALDDARVTDCSLANLGRVVFDPDEADAPTTARSRVRFMLTR